MGSEYQRKDVPDASGLYKMLTDDGGFPALDVIVNCPGMCVRALLVGMESEWRLQMQAQGDYEDLWEAVQYDGSTAVWRVSDVVTQAAFSQWYPEILGALRAHSAASCAPEMLSEVDAFLRMRKELTPSSLVGYSP